jgi:hypothetical protein
MKPELQAAIDVLAKEFLELCSKEGAIPRGGQVWNDWWCGIEEVVWPKIVELTPGVAAIVTNGVFAPQRTYVQVTAMIHLPGDPSVGISDHYINIDFGSWQSYHSLISDREGLRKGLREFYCTYFDCTTCGVWFGDEDEREHDFEPSID